MFRDMYDYECVKAALENRFPNQEKSWYESAASELIDEGSKDGDSTANLINRLF